MWHYFYSLSLSEAYMYSVYFETIQNMGRPTSVSGSHADLRIRADPSLSTSFKDFVFNDSSG